MLRPQDLFDLSEFSHAAIFAECEFVWEALLRIEAYIMHLFATVLLPGVHTDLGAGTVIDGPVLIGERTRVEPGVFIRGPAIIGEDCQIRHGAYVRGNLLAGNHCVVGHATEVKNSIFLDRAQASHFAYVGDSILGNRVNLGAGTRLANLSVLSARDPSTQKRPSLRVRFGDEIVDTGLSKLGAILGDDVQTGCNAVTNPGCIVGPRTLIYPLASLRKGYYPADSIVKLSQQMQQVSRGKGQA